MAKRRRKRIASRGSVNNIILKTLVGGDKYGYEIIKEVEEYSDGKISLKQPSLYSSLSRFEDKKFVSSYWEDSDIGGRRHYYHLTDLGMDYYRKHILKESDIIEDTEVDEDNDIITSEDIDDMEEAMADLNQSEAKDNCDNIIEQEETEELFDDTDEISNNSVVLKEINDSEIPAIVEFDTKTTQEDDFIADHQFHIVTPLEIIADNSNSLVSKANNLDSNNLDNVETSENTTPPWKLLSDKAKDSNKQYVKFNSSRLYLKKPKKEQQIILDTDGIFKLRDEDYVPNTTQTAKSNIIDNVIKRTNTSTIYGYDEELLYGNKSKPQKNSEISEEERKQRNENFLAKFNLITKSKMKPVSTPVQPKQEPKKEDKSIDYRNKLSAIFDSNNINDEVMDTQPIEETYSKIQDSSTNNLFNYVDEPQITQNELDEDFIFDNEQVEESSEDKYVDLEPVEEFEVKKENKQYIEKINTYSTTSSQVKLTRYENDSAPAILQDKTFVLINKLKLVFGIIMTLLMTSELIISLLLFKNNQLIIDNDMSLFICGFVIIGVFALINIIPYFFNSNSHKANNFRFSYSFWFGILTFLISIVLIYCINALMGFELDNFKFFAVKLIVPAIMTFNFVLGPIVYTILNKRQCFYD